MELYHSIFSVQRFLCPFTKLLVATLLFVGLLHFKLQASLVLPPPTSELTVPKGLNVSQDSSTCPNKASFFA